MTSRIILVLDSSGSMSSQRTDIIEGVNQTINNQKNYNPDESRSIMFTLVTFSDLIKQQRDVVLSEVEPLKSEDYKTTGSTALFDAIGRTIYKYQHEKNVIMVIATDGEENASSEYTYKQIVEMIRNCKQKMNWNFMYLSEDIDTFQQGNKMGLNNGTRSKNIRCKKGGMGSYMKSDGYTEELCKYRDSYCANYGGEEAEETN